MDCFHATQHLSDVGKAIYGPTSDLGRAWSKARHAELDEGDTDAIFAALAIHAVANEEARKCLGYGRGKSPPDALRGVPGGGAVHVDRRRRGRLQVAIGTRCKRTGMPWSVAGADAIIALRCYKLSGRFEDFWERRSSPRAAVA